MTTPRRLRRTAAAAWLALMLVALAGVAAGATEGGTVEVPRFEELRENAGETAQEFLPPDYEGPGFFSWMIFPLLIVGIIAFVAVMARYLQWQPRFAREREAKLKKTKASRA